MNKFHPAMAFDFAKWLSTAQKFFSGLFLLILVTAMTGQNARAVNYIYVNASATGLNNGKSWANAYTSLETAIAADVDTLEILVAGGTYKPKIQIGGTGPRYAAFKMKYGVQISGGYNADLGVQVDYSRGGANETILSGDIGIVGDASDNCYHVVHNPETLGLNTNSRLNRLTISGGNANNKGSGTTHEFKGGGVYNRSWSKAFFIECVFSNNSAVYGGGIYFIMTTSNYMPNCTFISNMAITNGAESGNGGAVYIDSKAQIRLENCLIINNTAGGTGGGIFVNSPTKADAALVNIFFCTIANNHANFCGGVRLSGYSMGLLCSNIIWGNTQQVTTNGRQISVSTNAITGNIPNGFLYNNSSNNIRYSPFFGQ